MIFTLFGTWAVSLADESQRHHSTPEWEKLQGQAYQREICEKEQ